MLESFHRKCNLKKSPRHLKIPNRAQIRLQAHSRQKHFAPKKRDKEK